ncbi:hypothetical protein EGM70_03665 [Enterobacteriaceae bacterium 89]|nr:hypothetical protein [Enterobacteriaceae bacterium 89]
MISHKVKLLWGVACISLLAAIASTWKNYSTADRFSCQGQTYIIGNNAVTSALYRLTLAEGKGKFDITSHVNQPGKPELSFQSVVLFNYLYKDENIIMVSQSDNTQSEKVKEAMNIPDFFMYSGRGLELRLSPLNRNSYLLSYGGSPHLYCKKAQLK